MNRATEKLITQSSLQVLYQGQKLESALGIKWNLVTAAPAAPRPKEVELLVGGDEGLSASVLVLSGGSIS